MRPEHPYAAFAHRVQKPSRYLGGEHGESLKAWDEVDCRFCFAFPDLYDIGMSHLGLKILYGIINQDPRLLCERAFAPWKDMEKELRAEGQPLRSLESWHALRDFDVVGFSLQFELTFTNVLLMLELGGIPLRSDARGEDDPLVIAGGPTATHAEPMACFIDAILIGDGEEITPRILREWASMKKAGLPRRERLVRLATMGGLYIPSLYETELQEDTGFRVVSRALEPSAPLPVSRAFVPDISAYPFPSGGPVSCTETVFDRVSVEIARGCTEGCRFCQAGMIYRPVRERDPEDIASTIQNAIVDGGYDEASLTCLSTADYSAISPLVKDVMKKLEGKNVSLSVSSLRAYGLSEELLDELRKVRATGLTFAPEAGSQRMRDVVNKNVTEAQLMETAERVFSRGWEKMKLYFMIGLPTEEDEDVRGIVETGARAFQVGKKASGGRTPRVTVSVSTHVPKPHTPFQWCAMDGIEEVRRKQRLLRDDARRAPVQLRMHDSEGSWLEGVLARGDRTLGDVIETAYHRGARFDSWEEELNLEAWQSAFTEHGVEPARFLGTIPVSARLPWDHIDVGLEEGFLAREYRRAMQNRLSPPCGKAVGMFIHHTNLEDATADARRLVCYDCGVACDMTKMREERLVFLRKLGAERKPAPKSEEERTRIVSPKERRARVLVDQGGFVRIRLAYTKLGRAAFTSHLDLVRLLPRLCRRLDLPLFYSQGFHPKPEMTFGPALSLGVASLAEYVDVKLRDDGSFDPAAIADRLDQVSVDGLRFTGARVLGAQDPGLNRVIDEARYVIALSSHTLRDLGFADASLVEAHVAEKMQGERVVRRTIEGIGKNVDVGRYLREVKVNAGHEILTEAGILGELTPIDVRLEITGGGTAKISEVVEVLFGKEVPARYLRVGLYSHRSGTRASPLELDLLRIPHNTQLEPAISPEPARAS